MENLESLEKAINSELTTKILSSKIKHDQINICIEDNNLIEVKFSKLKEKITENIIEPEKFKWLQCEDNNCEFWTREPKR